MGFLNICGFETGDLVEIDGTSVGTDGTVEVQASVVRTGGYALRVAKSAESGGVNGARMRSLGADGKQADFPSTFYASFYYRCDNLPPTAMRIFRGGLVCNVYLTTSGGLYLTDAFGSGASATISGAVSADTWVLIEVKVVSSGTCELKVGGSTVSTTGSGFSLADSFFGDTQGAGEIYDWYYDDIAFSDDDWVGAGEVRHMGPDGTGTYNSGVTGTYTSADEIPTNGDTDYIDLTTSGTYTATLESSSSAGIEGEIGTVKALIVARADSATGSPSTQVRLRSGSTDSDTDAVDISTTYVPLAKMHDVNPDDSAAWEASDLDGIEVGFAGDGNPDTQVTALMAMVWSAGAIVYSGSGAFTLFAPVASGSGSQLQSGSGAMSLWVPAADGSGQATMTATAAFLLLPPTLAGVGESVATGSADLSLLPPTLVGTGAQAALGSGELTLFMPIVAGAGTKEGTTGSGALVMLMPVFAGTGEQVAIGSGALALLPPTMAGSGHMVPDGSGAWALQPPVLAGAGVINALGTGAFILMPPTMAGFGTQTDIQGTGALALFVPVVSGAGALAEVGSGAFALFAPTLAGVGNLLPSGSGAWTLLPPTLAGNGFLVPSGSGALTLWVPTLAGTGRVPNTTVPMGAGYAIPLILPGGSVTFIRMPGGNAEYVRMESGIPTWP